MSKLTLLAVIAFGVFPAVARAETSSSPAAAEQPAKEKKICRTVGLKTDTRIGGGVRKCKTAAEWAQADSAGSEGRVQSIEADTIRRIRLNGAD